MSTNTTHAEIFGTTTNPCPAWCTLPTGHGYDDEDRGALLRHHSWSMGQVGDFERRDRLERRDIAAVHVYISALERFDRGTGRVSIIEGPNLQMDVGDGQISVQDALRLADVLTAAAKEAAALGSDAGGRS